MTHQTSFEHWFNEHLLEYAQDISNHGADQGYPGIIYIDECAKLLDQYYDEIWEWLEHDREEMGCENVAAMVATFRRGDMMFSIKGFKNLLVWHATEKLAKVSRESER